MPVYVLRMKAEVENVANIEISDLENFPFSFKFECNSCNEKTDSFSTLCLTDTVEVGRDVVNLEQTCALCRRSFTLKLLEKFYSMYKEASMGKWQPIIKIDCRGAIPVEFQNLGSWNVASAVSEQVFTFEASDEDFVEYDEKADATVEITEWNFEIVRD